MMLVETSPTNSRKSATFSLGSDANGNITDYTDYQGSTVAHFEYSPFGQVTFQSGEMADSFAYKFSTKYWDVETGLGYWGLRYYHPDLGRWISRDPIEESGGVMLYEFCRNDAVSKKDILGLALEMKSEGIAGVDPRPRMTATISKSGATDSLNAYYSIKAAAGGWFGWPDNGICNSTSKYGSNEASPSYVRGWIKDDKCGEYTITCSGSAAVKVWQRPGIANTLMGSQWKGTILGQAVYSETLLEEYGGHRQGTFVDTVNVTSDFKTNGEWQEIYYLELGTSVRTLADNKNDSGFSESITANCVVDKKK